MLGRPAARAASARRIASGALRATGFSQEKGLPAATAARAIGTWTSLGVPMSTASTAGHAMRSR